MAGRKPKPTALRRANGNPGKRAYNPDEPLPPGTMPDCPPHLSDEARDEWNRLAGTLHRIGILTFVDRGALAAYCQAWGRWVEAEEKLRELPAMVRTPSGHIQQNPWLSIANKQLEIMGRYMGELGITPSARSRVAAVRAALDQRREPVNRIEIVAVTRDDEGNLVRRRCEDGALVPEREDGNVSQVILGPDADKL